MVTGAQALVDCLRREKIDHVFGIPGTMNLPLLDVLWATPEIRSILTRHEQGAAFMAYGFARTLESATTYQPSWPWTSRAFGDMTRTGLTKDMIAWDWIVRGVAVAVALCLFMQWQGIGAQWAALFSFLLCAGGGEAIIAVSRRARERRRVASPPRRGGRRHTDPSC